MNEKYQTFKSLMIFQRFTNNNQHHANGIHFLNAIRRISEIIWFAYYLKSLKNLV